MIIGKAERLHSPIRLFDGRAESLAGSALAVAFALAWRPHWLRLFAPWIRPPGTDRAMRARRAREFRAIPHGPHVTPAADRDISTGSFTG